ncbi:nucleolin [Astatotilapia calliptera]|uniref:Nucleolin n=1 Tax=Astatotilapia calliptera TaxID=8154 RepID=A0AAX7VS47_ASTCA|nr:nucleolin [Astatotilapia calliptera]
MVKLAKAANKQAAQKKKAPPPPKEVEEESSEEDSSDEEEEAPPPKAVKKATPAKGTKVGNGTPAKKAESEDDDSDESEEEEAPPPKKTPAKATPAKKAPAKAAAAKAEESDDDDEEEDDESEEEAPPPKKAAKPAAKPPVKAQPAKESSDDDDDDESEEEAPPPKKATPAKPAAKAAKAQPAKEESSEEDDDEDDDDDDDSEEEMDTTPAPAATKAKKAGMVKAKEESEDDEEDDEDDDDEEDDDEEEEEKPTAAKRKAESKKDTPPAKKAKSEGQVFSLFVGNLNSSKDFDEIKASLRKFFSKNGLEITDVRLGGNKKFGYVDFASEEDLQKGLELNGKKVMGQEVKLEKARSKEGSQDTKKEKDARTLFVKNLPFSATADDLKEIFKDAVEIRVPPGQNTSNKGIAYVEFKTEADAERTMEETQGSEVQGRSIIIDYTGEKSHMGARASASEAASKTLVVNNLSFNATEEVLQSTFEKAVSIRIPQRDGRPKGFAFLEFESTDDAKDALENFNNTEIEGRSIRLEYSQSRDWNRGNSGPTKTLFVKGLSEDTTEETLKDAFEGAVAARIVTDRDTGSSKGFGFVDFSNEDDCKAAKEAMEDGEIDGSKVTLDYAKPKGEGGFRGGRGGGGFGGRGGGRGGRGGFGGFGGRGGGGRGRGGPRGGGRGRGGFGGGRGGGGFGGKPQGKKIKFDD